MITELPQVDVRETRARVHADCAVWSPANSRSLCLEFAASGDDGTQARFGCDKAFEGYAGMLHGGVIASLLDGAMTNYMFAHGISTITTELNVRSWHPVVVGQLATVRSWIERSSPPLYLLRGEVVQDEQLKAAALGKFMERRELTKGVESI